MKRRLKINGILIFCVLGLIAFFPEVFFRSAQNFFSQLAETFGFIFILTGQLLRISGRGFKSEHSQEGNLLIQAGPYALARNPMYLGILFIGIGIVMMLFKWGAVLIFLSAFVIRYVPLMLEEEKKLLKLFPGTYPAYCKSTPRILPSLQTISRKDITEYLPLKFSWLWKEIGSVSTVLLATLFIKLWWDIKAIGIGGLLREAIVLAGIIILFVCFYIYLSKKTKS